MNRFVLNRPHEAGYRQDDAVGATRVHSGHGGTAVVAAELNGAHTLSPGALVSIASQITAVAEGTCAVP